MPRCIGRRYPDAPYWTRVGCLERNPPFWFQAKTTGFVGPWDQYGDVWLDVPFLNPGGLPVPGLNKPCEWERVLVPGKLVEVHTYLRLNKWTLEVRFRQGLPGGSVPHRIYRETFNTGYPQWSGIRELVVVEVSPTWIWSGGNVCELRPCLYDLLPPGFCTP